MKNRFLETVMLQRAEEQVAALAPLPKVERRRSVESTRLPVYRETGPRKEDTARRASSRDWNRRQRRAVTDAWAAMVRGDLSEARTAVSMLSPGWAAKLRLTWVRRTGKEWPL